MKNKKYFYKKVIPVPIYYGKLVIILSNDPNKIKKKTDIKNKHIQKFKQYGILGWFTRGVYKQVRAQYIILNPLDIDFDLGVIVHESVHVTNSIFNDANIEPDLYNDENQAYLTEWVFKQTLVFYNKHKKTIKELD